MKPEIAAAGPFLSSVSGLGCSAGNSVRRRAASISLISRDARRCRDDRRLCERQGRRGKPAGHAALRAFFQGARPSVRSTLRGHRRRASAAFGPITGDILRGLPAPFPRQWAAQWRAHRPMGLFPRRAASFRRCGRGIRRAASGRQRPRRELGYCADDIRDALLFPGRCAPDLRYSVCWKAAGFSRG